MARNRQRAKERKQRQADPDAGSVDELADEIGLAGGAPPSDLGTVHPVAFDDDDDDDDDDDAAESTKDAGDRGSGVAVPRSRGGFRVVGFLKACWAELQRVQWPDRRQVGQATAVVLGFVVIAGAFLGLADLVAQRLVNLIL